MKKKTLCFDLDGVICQTNGNVYKNSRPIKKNITAINNLKKKGYMIKIFTARFMGRSKDDPIKAHKKGFKLTSNQLKKWGLSYDKLIMGKPTYDLFIDDKNLSFKKNWPEQLYKKLKLNYIKS
jgi:hypothetical protein